MFSTGEKTPRGLKNQSARFNFAVMRTSPVGRTVDSSDSSR
jgi:hypothetical protein